jgi:hypothetical protein
MMYVDEVFGPPLKQLKLAKCDDKVPTDVHIRALILVVDCSELPKRSVDFSKAVPVVTHSVIFVSTQEWKEEGQTWGSTTLHCAADPLRNLSGRKGAKEYLQSITRSGKHSGISIYPEVYSDMTGGRAVKSRDLEAIRTVVRTVAPLDGSMTAVGAMVRGTERSADSVRDDLRVSLVKGIVHLYKCDGYLDVSKLGPC